CRQGRDERQQAEGNTTPQHLTFETDEHDSLAGRNVGGRKVRHGRDFVDVKVSRMARVVNEKERGCSGSSAPSSNSGRRANLAKASPLMFDTCAELAYSWASGLRPDGVVRATRPFTPKTRLKRIGQPCNHDTPRLSPSNPNIPRQFPATRRKRSRL